MEVLLPVAVGLAAGLSALALTPARRSLAGPAGLARLAAIRAAGLLRRVSRAWVVGRALSWGPLERLARELSALPAAAALRLGPAEVVAALACGALVAAGSAALLMGSALAGLVAAASLVAAVSARDAALGRRRRREVVEGMPGIYRALSVAMGSGQTLAQAVEYVGSHERGPAATVFARMSLRLRCGIGTEEAVEALAAELGVPGADLLATALVISHRTGSPLRDLLLRSARLAERQGEFERLLSVKTAQARLSVRIVCLLPVVMVGVLALISPDFQQGLLTPSGAGCLAVAAALDGVALALIRRLMRGVM